MSINETKQFKLIWVLTICFMLFQIVFPIILPIKSLAANEIKESTLTTSIGNVVLKTNATAIKKDKTVEIEIYLTEVEGDYFSANFEYDETVFKQLSYSTDIIINSELVNWSIGGTYPFFSISRNSGNIYCTGLLATIKLTALKDASTSNFKLRKIYLCDSEYNDTAEESDENGELIAELQLPAESVEPQQYTIEYNKNTTDVVTGIPSNEIKIENIDYTIGAEPSRIGYTFKGWNTQADGNGTSYSAGAKYSANANLTLYATWEPIQTTLTVNPNGGVWEGSSNTQTITQSYGSTKTISNPTSTPNGNIIKFNANGGTVVPLQKQQTTSFDGWEDATLLNGTTYTFGTSNETLKAKYRGDNVELPTATKTGAIFLGWYDSQDNYIGTSGENYKPAFTTPNAIIPLIAKYQEQEYTLTIDANGGTYIGSTTIQGTYNSEVTVNNPTKIGYIVTLDNNDGTGTTTITQTHTFAGWTPSAGQITGTTYKFAASDATLTANYTPNSVDLATAERTGYTFKGWYTAAVNGTKINSPYTPTENITLYAHWEANKYTITFEPGQGGTVNDATKEVTYNQPYGTLPTPSKPGYTFTGWYDENDKKIEKNDIVNITEDTKLTAKWQGDIYTLTINPNGGEYNGSTQNTTIEGEYKEEKTISNPIAPNGYTVKLDNNDGTEVTSTVRQTKTFKGWQVISGDGTINGTTYTFGTQNGEIKANFEEQAVELPTLTRTGYTFTGWYESAQGGTKVNNNYMPTSDITLYAGWEENIYTITFNPGENGTVSETTKEVTYNQTYGALPIPVRPGYDFNGWYDENDKKIEENDIVNITSDITLKAKWLGAEYTVTFNPDGGEVNPTSKTVRNEGTYGELPVPTKTGYNFTGWINDNGDKIESTTIVNLSDNETLTAEWEAQKYIITFNPGENGTVSETTKEVTYNQPYGTLPIPTRPGYTFTGWYDANDNKTEENDIVNITEDKTLTAVWEGNEYTLTFDYDGGTGNTTNTTIKNGEPYGELPEASKEGHDFVGWYDQNGNKVESTNIVNTTSNITLKAHYETKKYNVTFKNDDGTEIKTITVEHGKEATFTGAVPEKPGVAEGYEAKFTGWDNEQSLKNITGDVTVTAKYEVAPIVYTITYYNLKEADNSSNPTTYTIEDSNFDLERLEDQGKYLFIGWFTSNEENAEKVTSIDTSKVGNIVLYAKWFNDELYLSSEKYKVGEKDIDKYEEGDIYLDKIEPETTVSELIDNCDTNGIITVIDKDGNVLEDDDLVGTGMTIKVTKDDEQIILTAIVMGDLSGDGKVTATDLSALNQTILYKKNLEEVVFKAADLDDNLKLTATDLSTVNQTILGTIELTYNKNNQNIQTNI